MKLSQNIIIVIILTLIISCQFDPYADSLTTVRPEFSDVVGTYFLDEQTAINTLTDKQKRSAKIIIYPDSNFKAYNVPNITGTSYFKYDGVISAKGKLNITIIGGIDNGTNQPAHEWGMKLDSMPANLQNIGLMGNKPPYKLIITYGDPDEGAVMIFSKKL